MNEKWEVYMDKILSKSGWYPGRKVDSHDMKYALIQEGFNVFPAAEAIFVEFGGLVLPATLPHFYNYIIDPVSFFALEDDYYYSTLAPMIAYYAYYTIQEPICLVGYTEGESEWGSEILILSESGKFYSFELDGETFIPSECKTLKEYLFQHRFFKVLFEI